MNNNDNNKNNNIHLSQSKSRTDTRTLFINMAEVKERKRSLICLLREPYNTPFPYLLPSPFSLPLTYSPHSFPFRQHLPQLPIAYYVTLSPLSPHPTPSTSPLYNSLIPSTSYTSYPPPFHYSSNECTSLSLSLLLYIF